MILPQALWNGQKGSVEQGKRQWHLIIIAHIIGSCKGRSYVVGLRQHHCLVGIGNLEAALIPP